MKKASEIVIEHYGQPDSALSVTVGDGRVLQVLIYRPIEEEELYETWFITAGLSAVLSLAGIKSVEICLDIHGSMSPESETEMATIFAKEMHAVLQDNAPAANQLLSSVNLSPYFNTTAGILVSVDLDQLVYLDNEGTTSVLQFFPIFIKELDELEQIPPGFRNRTLILSKINWFDSSRSAENILVKTLTNEWNKVMSWYKENAPNLLSGLKPGQTSEELNMLEENLNFSIPSDLRVFLSLHNGGLTLHQYTLLSTDEIFTYHINVKDEIKKHSFLHADDKYYWPANAVPFAGDFKMSVIGVRQPIDKTEDNVFLFNHSYGYSNTKWSCFLHWLHDYAFSLQKGMFVLDETGKILLPV
ncbi:hypothetical protein BH11BAC7_BH11BAC7_28980 [soil metagenome]